jgi:hypothetical protein
MTARRSIVMPCLHDVSRCLQDVMTCRSIVMPCLHDVMMLGLFLLPRLHDVMTCSSIVMPCLHDVTRRRSIVMWCLHDVTSRSLKMSSGRFVVTPRLRSWFLRGRQDWRGDLSRRRRVRGPQTPERTVERQAPPVPAVRIAYANG